MTRLLRPSIRASASSASSRTSSSIPRASTSTVTSSSDGFGSRPPRFPLFRLRAWLADGAPSQVLAGDLAEFVVFFVFPQMRSGFLSLQGSSWKRSALCFLIPICFACIAYAIESEKFSWKLGFDLVVWGFACLGEELGWRGFLQGALRPLGRIPASLLLSL